MEGVEGVESEIRRVGKEVEEKGERGMWRLCVSVCGSLGRCVEGPRAW